MDSGGGDRRVRRTKRILLAALVELIEERGYEAIRIQDILDRAEIARSTFYAHFDNKAELLLSGFEHLAEELERHDREVPSGERAAAELYWDACGTWFRHAGGRVATYRALMRGVGAQLVSDHLGSYFGGLLRRSLAGRLTGSRVPPGVADLLIHHGASSLLALTRWWLDAGAGLTANEMSDAYRRLLQPAIEAVLGAGGRPAGPRER